MKWLIASDIHGSAKYCKMLMDRFAEEKADRMLILGKAKTQIKVVSKKSEEIRRAILQDIDRGVTVMYGRTGYLGKDTEINLSIVSTRELAKTEKLVHEIDPEAFIIVSRVSEVKGRGFTEQKKYL